MELPAPGQIFQRKYKLQEILGRGGFAAVFRATDVEIGRDVAIKILAPGDDGYSTGIASRFMREARVIGGFQDPHTITMFEFGRSDDGLLFMVFEYVKGTDLSGAIRARGPLAQPVVIHILKQVLQSLREAHAAGVLHRDIKPANILVYDYMGDPNRVKLLDFGIAKAVAGDADGINLTREGAMIGTPRYMSPEQIYGGELGPQSDLYSLGLVAHEMLVGRPAISGTTSKEMLRAQLADDPVRLPRDRVLATEAFCALIDRLTARDPTLRFETAADVSHALDWVEKNDAEPVPLAQSGHLAGMPVSGISPAYATPRDISASGTGDGQRPVDRSWERAAQGPPRNPTGGTPIQPPAHQYPSGRHSGGLPAYPSGTHYPSQTGSGVYQPVPDDSVPPSTERPRTFEEEENDISLGTILGAGLGAAALVVGLLMLMSFLSSKGSAPTPEPAPPDPTTAPANPAPAEPAPAEPAVAQPPDAAPVAQAAPVPRSGCADTAPWRGEKMLSTQADGARREWLTYLPINYAPQRKYPVVLMFHKLLKDGPTIVHNTQFKEIADQEGFIIIAPNALDTTAPWPRSDGPVMKTVVAETAATVCVDTTKVYAIGHGQGAAMVRNLPCDMPISAIAETGAALREGETLCTAETPTPLIRFHGTRDRYTPFKGGTGCLGGEFRAVNEIEAIWRERNACTDKRTRYSKQGEHVCYTWPCAGAFVSCHLDGGHDWPTAAAETLELPSCVAKAPDYPIGREIWKFFQTQGRTLEPPA